MGMGWDYVESRNVLGFVVGLGNPNGRPAMITKLDIRIGTASAADPVIIQSRESETAPIRLRIGGPSGPGTRYANLTPSQARQIAQFLLAATERSE